MSPRLLPLFAALALAGAAHAQLRLPGGGAGGAPAAPAPTAPAPAAAPAAAPANEEKENAARLAAGGWLTLLDRRDWGTAWETSSQTFRRNVPLDRWLDGVPKVRADLGGLQERAPSETAYKTELPGQPRGEYVTVLFVSRFEQREIEEIVTTVREPDGRWRVTGYSTR